MATPHNRAANGEIAKTVLMPGDPLRAKWIAETYLTDVQLVSDVRNVYCYTGEYKGVTVSVMASGMGMPSIGIYSYELYKFYDVENIIRIGSAGAYTDKLKVSGPIHSSDVFYHEADANDVLRKMVDAEGLLCVEMESFALFHNAEVLGRNAACLLTISDSLVTGDELDADTRATAFAEMVELALEAAIAV